MATGGYLEQQTKMQFNSMEERNMMKDPAKAHCRIYVGSLPTDTMNKQDLHELFSSFGKIEGILMHRGFAFVQFLEEGPAKEVLNLTTKMTFRDRPIDIRQARIFDKGDKRENYRDPVRDRSPIVHGDSFYDRGRDITPYPVEQGPRGGSYTPQNNLDRANDCEIIVTNKKNTALVEYAEFIEMRLKKLGLTVDVLFPNEEVPLPRVLASIANRGSLYAIVIMPQNEEHRSLTVNILYGQPQEHRNMPLEDALNLIAHNFEAYIKREKASRPSEVNIVPAAGPITALNLTDRHPEAIQVLLNLLADNRQLTALQYDRVLQYLQERREMQLKVELGEDPATVSSSLLTSSILPGATPKQAELQNRILSILNNKKAATPPASSVQVPMKPVVPASASTNSPLLNDPNVQKALDSLITGDLFKKFSGSPAQGF